MAGLHQKYMGYATRDLRCFPRLLAVIAAKGKSGECLKCKQRAVRGRRGLCWMHYDEFREVKNALPTYRQVRLYEIDHILNGQILPPGLKK